MGRRHSELAVSTRSSAGVLAPFARLLFRRLSSWTVALWPALLRSASFKSTGRSVLPKQVGERLVGQFLKRFHLIARKQVKRLPSLVVQLDTLAGH
jgi:hypothetical protein